MSQEYDVIIVGGGSSGSTLAARLSEDPNRSVLLLEAGTAWRSVDELPDSVRNPADIGNVLPGQSTNFTWEAEADGLPAVGGRGLGGSGAVNGAYFVRGIPANFEDWVRAGNDEWSYDKVLPYYKRSESDQDFPDSDAHGDSGPIPVRREPEDRAPEFTQAFTEGCLELGHPDDPDKNGGSANGIGPIPFNIENGVRMSAGVAYVMPNLDRPNLRVLGDAYAHRVILEGTRCVGVEVDVKGKLQSFRASEVVLSAGAMRSPQLLMLSGIGPAEQLREHGIDVVVDLPGVGANLTDHPELSFPYSLDAEWTGPAGRAAMTSMLNWDAEGSDHPSDLELLPFVASVNQIMNMGRVFKSPRMMKGMAKEMVKMIRQMGFKAFAEQGKSAKMPFMLIALQQKEGRGTLKLKSSNPKDPLRIFSTPWGDERDRLRIHQGIKMAHELFQTGPMRSVNAQAHGLDSEALKSRETLDEWLFSHIFAAGHTSCTAKMGPQSDPMAAVDQYGRVYGIDNLRVCDTSIFPLLPSRGPNATAIMIAERMSDFIGSQSSDRVDRDALPAEPGAPSA